MCGDSFANLVLTKEWGLLGLFLGTEAMVGALLALPLYLASASASPFLSSPSILLELEDIYSNSTLPLSQLSWQVCPSP